MNCYRCKEDKPEIQFYIDSHKKRGRRSYCRPCMADYEKMWRQKHKADNLTAYREKERRYNLARYKITAEEYDRLTKEQGGLCALCKQPATNGTGKRLHVDHDHTTGRVRGLLCHGCNTGLGAFGESAELLNVAADYLRSFLN